MATNSVHAGDRIEIVSFGAAHKAGDLVYEQGWYGVVEEDVAAGKRGYIIPGRVWLLPRVPSSNLAAGTAIYAFPTTSSTGLLLAAGATTGYNKIGRTIATGNASVAPVLLGHPNLQY